MKNFNNSLFTTAMSSLIALSNLPSFAASITDITINGDYNLINANTIEEALQNSDSYVNLISNRNIINDIRFYQGSYVETGSQSDLENYKTSYINLLNSTNTTTLLGTLNHIPVSIRNLTYQENYGESAITETLNNLVQPASNPLLNPNVVFAPLTNRWGINQDQWWTQVLNQYYNFETLAQLQGTDRDTLQTQFINDYGNLLNSAISPLNLSRLGIDYITQDSSSLVTIGLVTPFLNIGSGIGRSLQNFFIDIENAGNLSFDDILNIPTNVTIFAIQLGGYIEYNNQSIFIEPQAGIFTTDKREITFQGVSVSEPSNLVALISLGLFCLFSTHKTHPSDS